MKAEIAGINNEMPKGQVGAKRTRRHIYSASEKALHDLRSWAASIWKVDAGGGSPLI